MNACRKDEGHGRSHINAAYHDVLLGMVDVLGVRRATYHALSMWVPNTRPLSRVLASLSAAGYITSEVREIWPHPRKEEWWVTRAGLELAGWSPTRIDSEMDEAWERYAALLEVAAENLRRKAMTFQKGAERVRAGDRRALDSEPSPGEMGGSHVFLRYPGEESPR